MYVQVGMGDHVITKSIYYINIPLFQTQFFFEFLITLQTCVFKLAGIYNRKDNLGFVF